MYWKGKYTADNYFTCTKFLKSAEHNQLPQHLDARGINKLFHYLTRITHVFMCICVSVFIYDCMSVGVCI